MAITDIFSRRYRSVAFRPTYFREDHVLMNQVAAMIMDPLWLGNRTDTPSASCEAALKEVHQTLALELGREWLSDRYFFPTFPGTDLKNGSVVTNTYSTICKKFLTDIPSDVNAADSWIKERVSFIELVFAYRGKQIATANSRLPIALAEAKAKDNKNHLAVGVGGRGLAVEGVENFNRRMNATYAESCNDLNERFRQASYGLEYHNGLIQFSSDQITTQTIISPFWSAVTHDRWANVDYQMKEALDKRDRGERDAVSSAMSALESAIKIISDTKGWTKGTERGAANYIDNLVIERDGIRFIEVWEKDALIKLFSDIRNRFGHGPGSAPMPRLLPQQTNWAIEACMSWVKSLVLRMGR